MSLRGVQGAVGRCAVYTESSKAIFRKHKTRLHPTSQLWQAELSVLSQEGSKLVS